MKYYVSHKKGRRKPRPSAEGEEKRMSREDDFDDIMDSDVGDTGQDETSEPLLEDESMDEPVAEEAEVLGSTSVVAESVEEERPAPSRRPAAKKKKKAVAKPKAKAKKKKAAKPARKPAAKKTAKKPAKKKKRPVAKKKQPAAKKKKTARKKR
jgi:hypothetical protein